MRAAALLLVLAVCDAASRSPGPRPDRPTQWQGQLEETAARDARRGRFEASTRAYRRLAQVSPTAPSRCRWQIAVVRNALMAGNRREATDEILLLAAIDRAFAGDGVTPPDERQGCRRARHDQLVELVFLWNRELTTGCTISASGHWPDLERLFHEFLADFPGDPRAPEARRQLERLLALERGEPRWQIDHGGE